MENKVLIMDNDAHTRRELCNLFSKKGGKVSIAPVSDEAMESIRKEHFDLILLDMASGMDGIEVLKRIREQTIRTRVIMLSGKMTRIWNGRRV